jgi:hypothetical protein
MRRAILFVLLLLTPALALAVPVRRDRERELLEKNWGTPVDPDGDCSFRAEQGRLFIKIPGKPHILAAEIGQTNGPRVLREAKATSPRSCGCRGRSPSIRAAWSKDAGPSMGPDY